MNRVRSVDIFKSVGIICMLFSHTSMCEQSWSNYYNCFYMPMFFCITGYFYHDNTLLKFIGKKAKSLLLPYFCIGSIAIVIQCIILKSGRIPLDKALDALFIHSTSDFMPIVGAIWFLMALFWAETVFCILKKTKSEIILGIGCVTLAMVGCSMHRFTDVRLIWSLDSAMVGLGFIYIGYLVSKFKDSTIIKKALSLPVYIIVPLLIINIYMAGTTYITMWRNSYNNIPLLWINAIIGSLVWFNICKHIDNCKLKDMKPIAKLLAYIGNNSIVFLCCNQLVLFIGKRLIRYNFGWPTTIGQTRVWFAVLFVFALLSLLLLSHLNLYRRQMMSKFRERLKG